jgi:predicted phage terminase large subunit-like protein
MDTPMYSRTAAPSCYRLFGPGARLRWNADRLVAESNQGGLMVEQTVRTVDQNVSFRSVHASRGKITRAEPIAALFEQQRVHLARSFPELEDELCSFTAGSLGSPDRLDAMVWALTDLMVVSSDGMGFFEYVRRQHEAMMTEKAVKAGSAS